MGNKARMYVDIMALNPEVTGSCFLCVLKLPDKECVKFIVDCGLFQEEKYDKYNFDFPFDPEEISFALLTHNHVDHTGRLPLLFRQGFNSKIYCSKQTRIFLPLALNDSCKVLRDVCKRKNIKQLYTDEDVEKTIANTVGVEFNSKIEITPNISITLLKNGHLVGAAMILVEIHYPGEEDINLLFSGDYNNKNSFFDVEVIPEEIKQKRISLIIESTYGKMNSSEISYTFEKDLLSNVSQEKTIIIPVFSLGRSQEILLNLKELQCKKLLDPNIPIFFDGKLAHNYTNLYLKNDEISKKKDFVPENLTFVDSTTRAKLLNTDSCKIIVTTSGMGTYGPAQQYLPYFVSKTKAAIIFTGYTAEKTLGRILQETPKGEFVKIGGLLVKKNAEVLSTTEFSSHAKGDEILELVKQFENLRAVLINHGEEDEKEEMAKRVINEVNISQIGILDREYFFRIDTWGVNKTLSTKFK